MEESKHHTDFCSDAVVFGSEAKKLPHYQARPYTSNSYILDMTI